MGERTRADWREMPREQSPSAKNFGVPPHIAQVKMGDATRAIPLSQEPIAVRTDTGGLEGDATLGKQMFSEQLA